MELQELPSKHMFERVNQQSNTWTGYMFRCKGKNGFEIVSSPDELTSRDIEYLNRGIGIHFPDFDRYMNEAQEEVRIPAIVIGTTNQAIIPMLRLGLAALIIHQSRPETKQFYYVVPQ